MKFPKLWNGLAKALRKNPDERYQTTREILADLRRIRQSFELDAELARAVSEDIPMAPFCKDQRRAHIRGGHTPTTNLVGS